MDVRIFLSKRFQDDCRNSGIDEKILIQEFKKYKTTGILPKIFGREAPYDRPSAALFAELMHIHVEKDGKWKMHVEKLRQYDRVSDAALVYCTGWRSKESYLLIAFLPKNAHQRMRSVTFAAELAEIAEGFREKF